eukprot:TRINITY_DN5847_c1_g2_i1.p1 TRINITY_DN5847_c1_g2~~TRINITY_DN5847_c1_g2_i1.p1  ORF type:complete len:365 (+),score=58.00 TRINITY_DN5847_c1_g2_i1:11-1105(+)
MNNCLTIATILTFLTLICTTTTTQITSRDVLLSNGNTLNTQFINDGDATKETLILLHGWPEGSVTWQTVAAELGDSYRLVMPNLRGYNGSKIYPLVEDYHIKELVVDVVELVNEITQRGVFLVGHDWGGVVAWVFAHQHPGLLKGLMIIDAPHPNIFINLLQNNAHQQYISSYILFILKGETAEHEFSKNNFADFIEGFRKDSWWSDELESNYLSAWMQEGEFLATMNWYRANIITDHKNGTYYFSENTTSTFPEKVTVKIPVKVLWGENDTAFLYPNILDGLDNYVKDLTVKTYPGQGHFLTHEIPDVVAQSIRDFVKEHKGYRGINTGTVVVVLVIVLVVSVGIGVVAYRKYNMYNIVESVW